MIAATALELKAAGKVQPPVWAEFAKTGVNREMPPTNPDWWFVRSASILRRIGSIPAQNLLRRKEAQGSGHWNLRQGQRFGGKRIPAAAGEGRPS
nr:40S ribosomal protein S19 [Methanothrix sp.]